MDGAQIGYHGLAYFPANEVQTVPHHVHDTQLGTCLRKHRFNRLGKALEAIHASDEDVLYALVFQLCDDLQPELGAFGLRHPQA